MASLNLTGVLQTHREEILRILSRNGLSNPRIFGSAARGEDRPDSDIEDILGRTVDLVTERSLNPYIRESVIEEVVPL